MMMRLLKAVMMRETCCCSRHVQAEWGLWRLRAALEHSFAAGHTFCVCSRLLKFCKAPTLKLWLDKQPQQKMWSNVNDLFLAGVEHIVHLSKNNMIASIFSLKKVKKIWGQEIRYVKMSARTFTGCIFQIEEETPFLYFGYFFILYESLTRDSGSYKNNSKNYKEVH